VKEQIRKSSLDGMNDHQVLEALLFYTIPQGDTNETAHELLNACGGTLAGVMNADYSKLTSVKGIGPHTAHFINFLRLFTRRYLLSAYAEHPIAVSDAGPLCELFGAAFLGAVHEEIHAAAFDGNGGLICEKKLADGCFESVTVSPRLLLDFAASNRCSDIVIAHNHPHSSCIPSREDIELTAQYHALLAAMDVNLKDHIIIGCDSSFSLRSSLFAGQIWEEPQERRKHHSDKH
jgi:DNA repair protein RadC